MANDSDSITQLAFNFIPELAFVADVEAAVTVPELIPVVAVPCCTPVAATPPLIAVGFTDTTPEPDETGCGLAEASWALKGAGVIVVVYPGSKESVVNPNAVKGLPGVLDKGSLPGSSLGRLSGL